jgi:hypothetical protein
VSCREGLDDSTIGASSAQDIDGREEHTVVPSATVAIDRRASFRAELQKSCFIALLQHPGLA